MVWLPSGGSPEKPVGCVYIGGTVKLGGPCQSKLIIFSRKSDKLSEKQLFSGSFPRNTKEMLN